MRRGAAILAVMGVAVLIGGGGSGTAIADTGLRLAPTGHAARVDRNVRRRNHGAFVRCVRRSIPDSSGVSTWECNVRLRKHPGAEALVEVITGDALPYGIGECRSTTPNYCKLIH